jgi:hypothetical protein
MPLLLCLATASPAVAGEGLGCFNTEVSIPPYSPNLYICPLPSNVPVTEGYAE